MTYTGAKAESHYDNSHVYLMDCMDALKQTPDNYYCLSLVDPPYGIGMSKGTFTYSKKKNISSKRNYTAKKWDAEIPCVEYFTELQRISKHQIIWGGNYFADLLPAKRGWIYWDKKITNANNTNFSDGELAWTSFDCILRKYTYDWVGFGYLNSKERGTRQHPTQKPIALYDWIYHNYLPNGGKVIDTHLGSQSNRISADKAGNIDFYGFEIDEDYFNTGNKRFQDYKRQLKLF